MPLHDLLCYYVKKHLKKHLPLLTANIKKMQIPDSFWITKMIISLFLYVMDLNNCVRVWDYIITRGAIRAMPEVIVALIAKYQHKIVGADFEEFANMF